MLERLFVTASSGTEPYWNLAVEEYLMRTVEPGACILYLWQNRQTVVIGRNQSAFDECRVPELEADGGHLARRLSGGGAVYHDLGNLNFTFLVRKEDYDVARQTDVILQAVRLLGIHAEKNGRNDLTVAGRKFSGHAYYTSGGCCYHHGTLMIDVALGELGRYLRPAPEKLHAKGVGSVRSRVVNLRDCSPDVTIGRMAESLRTAFGQVYHLPVEELPPEKLDTAAITRGMRRFASDAWRYGEKLSPGERRSARFPWGGVQFSCAARDGRITDVILYSDGLEADYLHDLPQKLRGCPVSEAAILQCLTAGAENGTQRQMAKDMAALLSKYKEGEL